MFAKWEDKAVWTPFLKPTVNINSFMSDGASPTARRTIIPRTAHARLDIRLTPDTPVAGDARHRPARGRRPPAPHAGHHVHRRVRRPARELHLARAAGVRLASTLAGGARRRGAVALPILGGTLPLRVFTDVLGIPASGFRRPTATTSSTTSTSTTCCGTSTGRPRCTRPSWRHGLFEDGGPRDGPPLPPRPSGATAAPWQSAMSRGSNAPFKPTVALLRSRKRCDDLDSRDGG